MNSMTKQIKLILIFIFLISSYALSHVKLPKLISDGMVLQRDMNVKIWGWAAIRENISINFHDSTYRTTANDSGAWQIRPSKQKAGGPYSMTLTASDTIIVKDIFIGDVWVCSGQSNMELPMKSVRLLYESDFASSDNTSMPFDMLGQIIRKA
jgi:sialate O-acetylesterase